MDSRPSCQPADHDDPEMLNIRKSDIFMVFISGCCLVLVFFAGHAVHENKAAALPRQRSMSLVSDLSLTDPCLFTEARYTRHPSQADRHSPFQDHPMSLEHFPAGALLTPPGAK
jgi:hypothetical protein